MPVQESPWLWPRDLHPFFRQNLPEGYLLNVIREEFGRFLDGTDISLLAIVGGSGIGRISVTPEGGAPEQALQPLEIQHLLTKETSSAQFAALVHEYSRAAISGAVPKFIAPNANSKKEKLAAPTGKTTLRTARHIVKGSDEATPYLGFNEFYSMRVLERLQVATVAATRMSADGRLLIVDRFDVDAGGIPSFGVEDACSLLGLPPHEKYVPSMEKVVAATSVYIPTAARRAQLERLGWLIVTNFVVRNADCHSKNIALFYRRREEVRFAPAYDIVTTQAYPRFANNDPGLSIAGRKTWAPGKSLEQFFNARLGIAPRAYAEMVERVCESAVEMGREVIAAARNETRWRTVAKQMLHAWNEGMASLRSVRSEAKYKALSADIAKAPFSDPEPPERSKAAGRSELLGSRTKPRPKKKSRKTLRKKT